MKIFPWEEDKEEAYERGQKDAAEAGIVDQIAHDLSHLIPAETGEEKAYEAGYHNE